VRRHAKALSKGGLEAAGSSRRARVFLVSISSVALLAAAFLSASVAAAYAGPLVLPDNRAWEQVSPVDKSESDISTSNQVASITGNALVFHSSGSFAGQNTAVLGGTDYLGTRNANGWTTTGISMPYGQLNAQNGYFGFTEDLSKGVVRWMENSPILGTYDPEAALGMNLYLRDNLAGTFSLLNGTLEPARTFGGFVWGSSDFSHIAFDSSSKLTVDAPCGPEVFGSCSYEWDNGVLRLASVLPGGEPALGVVGDDVSVGNTDNAVSVDGARLFFSSPVFPGEVAGAGGEVYARENGESTTHVSAPERTLPGGTSGEPVHYAGAEAAHGDQVVFTTKNALVDTDTDNTNDLYLYDFTAPAGQRLTLISEDQNPEAPVGAQVDEANLGGGGGVVAKSEDLRRVYFIADNQIVAGAPTAPGPKLYLWDDTGTAASVSYIATLKAGDHWDWAGPSVSLTGGGSSMRPARPSSDGRFLAFLSSARLTSFDNEGKQEIYLYDALGGSIECASCSSDALPAAGYLQFDDESSLPPVNHLLKNTSDGGQVFFETSRGLVPRDSNGKIDVYEYEDGQLHLISPGTGGDDSHFLDATPSGSDVFFTTRDRLVGWDDDKNVDAYDARVNGGLPEPPPQPPACEGDACQPPPMVPSDPSPASAGFRGPGNPSAHAKRPRRSCVAGKVRRQGKCRKKRHRGTSSNGRKATRSHG
jgi:hypothetical protein